MSESDEFARLAGGRVVPSAPAASAEPSAGDVSSEEFARLAGGKIVPSLSLGEQIVGGAERALSGASSGVSGRASDAVQGLMRGGIPGLGHATSESYARGRDQARAERERRSEGLGGMGTALEVAGAVAPVLLSGGMSTLASVARAAPTAVVTRAGEQVVEQLLGRLGKGALAGVAKTAMAGGFVGAIQRGVAEAADQLPRFLETPIEAAEHVLWEAGKGALEGFGIGALFGGGAAAARKTLQLGSAAAQKGAEFASVVAPQRAVVAVARGGRLGPELEKAGGADAVGRILLEEGVPLAGGADEVLQSLRGKVAGASKALLDLEHGGKGSAAAMGAAQRREQALIYARNLAEEAVRSAPERASSAAVNALSGAAAGALMGGAPGALLGAAGGKYARGLVGERATGLQALAFQQFSQLAAQRGALVMATDRVSSAIDGIARGATRAASAGGPPALRSRDIGTDLDEQISHAAAQIDPETVQHRTLKREAERLDMIEPGLGLEYFTGALRRAQLLSEGVGPRPTAVYAGKPEVDSLTRLRIARRASALNDPDAALARVARGTESGEDASTIATVYPRAWKRFQAQLSEHLAAGKKMDYRDAVNLGVRTGIETVPSLSPESLMRSQQSMSESSLGQQGSPAHGPSFSGNLGKKSLERYGDKADRMAARGSQ
jgi:hypothetical protein